MRNTILHLPIFILFSFLSNLTFTQVIADYKDISIFYGDKQKAKVNVKDFTKTKSENILCIQNQFSLLNVFSRNNSKYSFGLISGYKLPPRHPITFYGNGKNTSLLNHTILGDNVLGISVQTTFLSKDQKLYYHFINLSSQGKSNHGFPLNEYFFSINTEIDLSKITLITSPDKKYASMIYVHESGADNYKSIKYLNFKDGLPLPQRGEFVYPFPKQEYKILDFFVKDDNTQYIISGNYADKSPKIDWNNSINYFESITIGRINDKEFKFEILKDEGKFFSEIDLFNVGTEIILSGLYSNFMDKRIEGVFTAEISNKGKVIDKKYAPFSSDIKVSIAEYSLVFLNDQSTIKNEYVGFNLLEIHRTASGFLGIAEFNALEYRYGSADVPGATNTVDSYFWSNNIIVFKLNFKGEMDWDKIIPKYQRSINDGGYNLSTTAYLDSEHLHLFFNDNKLNYNLDGEYIRNGDVPFAAQFNSGKNTIAHVKLRLEDGLVKRKCTIGKEETEVLFVPLLSRSFMDSKKMMIYGRSGNKQRIGSISFREK